MLADDVTPFLTIIGIESCENDNNEFWKKIGRLGIGFERRKAIPLEIIREHGSLSNNA